MSILPILRWPDPRLQVICDPVREINSEIETLAQDLLETMYDAPGRGLAAPQVGVLKRIFVMDATWKDGKPDPQVFINPVIEEVSDARVSSAEGCLSIPGILSEISRPARVQLSWMSLTGGEFRQVFDGFAATCIQHETDHLNGRVVVDRLSAAARAKAEADYEALT